MREDLARYDLCWVGVSSLLAGVLVGHGMGLLDGKHPPPSAWIEVAAAPLLWLALLALWIILKAVLGRRLDSQARRGSAPQFADRVQLSPMGAPISATHQAPACLASEGGSQDPLNASRPAVPKADERGATTKFNSPPFSIDDPPADGSDLLFPSFVESLTSDDDTRVPPEPHSSTEQVFHSSELPMQLVDAWEDCFTRGEGNFGFEDLHRSLAAMGGSPPKVIDRTQGAPANLLAVRYGELFLLVPEPQVTARAVSDWFVAPSAAGSRLARITHLHVPAVAAWSDDGWVVKKKGEVE